MKIPFNKPLVFGDEISNIKQSLEDHILSGDGKFTRKCNEIMEKKFNAKKVMLTTSCTHALEMASILIDLQPGDEVICPSYTFVSTVNSFILRGAKPVFVDIREDTLNIDENLIEEKITDKTRAVFPVHYGGVSCEMAKINEIAQENNLLVVEDAAQGVNAKYKNKYLGTIGDLGTYSFHESKNYICGEGGALIVNNEKYMGRAEIIREKGTNRSKFFRGEVDKYTWVDIGSSYLPADILAAFLYEQLINMDTIKNKRKEIFDYYYENLKDLELKDKFRLPIIPKECETNYHIFYILLTSERERDRLLKQLKKRGIHSVFHYIPLHTSPMGTKFGYKEGDLPNTEDLSKRILRLPFYYDLTQNEQKYIINNVYQLLDYV
jgi:dTDP-4-amino-4,6-dideoxygalactose transaminase